MALPDVSVALSPNSGTLPYTTTATVAAAGGTGANRTYEILDWGDGSTSAPQSAATFTKTIPDQATFTGRTVTVRVAEDTALDDAADAPTSPAGIPGTWSRVFVDDFNGTTLNGSKWNTPAKSQNNVTTSAANVSVHDGSVWLQLSDSSTGALISTSELDGVGTPGFELQVGDCVEMRTWFPGDVDVAGDRIWNWPAVWTSGHQWPSNGELDFAEGLSGRLTANYHYGADFASHVADNSGPISGNYRNEWHVYAVHRKATSADFYWDGVLVRTVTTHDAGGGHTLIANLGKSNSRTLHTGQAGALRVDYVAAYRPAGGGGGTAPLLTARVSGPGGTTTAKTTGAASVRLKAGTDTAVTQGVVYSSAATPDADGWVRLPKPAGLTAGQYYYARMAMTNSGGSESLDTMTAPLRFRAAPTGQTSFNFCFGACTDASDSTAMAAVAGRNDDLLIHLGDLWYSDGSNRDQANYRAKMTDKITAANHAAALRVSSLVYQSSDHDFSMANNGNGTTTTTGRDSFNAAYRQVIPTPTLPSGSLGCYHTFTWGRVRFLNLDLRTFASDPAATDNASKSTLGTVQKQWLKDTLTGDTTSKLFFLSVDSSMIGSASAGDDGWLGFTTERAELRTFIASSGRNVIALSGDMHALAADDGSNNGGIAQFSAAPFDNSTSIKGGPYTGGTYPTSPGARMQQYGRVVVTDTGATISAAFTGYSADNTSRVSLTKTYSLTPPPTGGIQQRGTPSVYENASGTSVTIPVPSGVQAGDLLVASVTQSNANDIATPSGWTLTAMPGNTQSNAARLAVFHRVATGNEPANYTMQTFATAGRVTGIVVAYSGVNTTPLDTTPTTVEVADTLSPVSAPSLTTTTANTLLLSVWITNAASSATGTPPSQMTAVTGSTTIGRRTLWAAEPRPTAGATGARTWQLTGSTPLAQQAVLVALRPV